MFLGASKEDVVGVGVYRTRSEPWSLANNLFNTGWRYLQKGVPMLEEASEIIGMQVYTPNGVFLGNVNNLVVDVEERKVDGLFVSESNPLLVEDSKAVNVPFRWIQAIGDIVLLKYFPKRVNARRPAPKPAEK
jgi:sporulation protein YlmC with PRC-barrel domain